jgi:hypothetical protein
MAPYHYGTQLAHRDAMERRQTSIDEHARASRDAGERQLEVLAAGGDKDAIAALKKRLKGKGVL